MRTRLMISRTQRCLYLALSNHNFCSTVDAKVFSTRWWRRSQELLDTPLSGWFPQEGETSRSTFLFPSKVACQVAVEECLQRLSMQIVDDEVTRDKSWKQLNSCWNQITQDHQSVLLTGRMVQMYLHGLIHHPHANDNDGEEMQYWFQYMTQKYLENGHESWCPTVESLSSVLHCISDAKKARALLEQYLSLKDTHDNKHSTLVCSPNVYCFVNVLLKYTKNNTMLEEAETLWHDMQFKYNITPTLHSYNVMLQIYAFHKGAAFAEQFLSQIPDPDVWSYAQILQAWTKENNPYRAQQILDEMKVAPNTTCYNTVLTAHAAQEKGHAAESLFQYMLESSLYDLQSLNIMLKLYRSIPQKAQDLLEWMEQNQTDSSTQPDIYSYNTVLHAWASHGNASKSQAILESILEKDPVLKPDVYSFNTVMSAWVKSMIKPKAHQNNIEQLINQNQKAYRQVEKIFFKMQTNDYNIQPDTVSFNTCISASSKTGNVNMALQYLKQLEENESTKPNVISYSSVLDAYVVDSIQQRRQNLSKENFSNLVLPLFKRMEYHRVRPNVIIYNTVLNILTVEEANDFLLRYMIRDKNIYDGISYFTVLSAWSNDTKIVDKGVRSKHVLDNLMEKVKDKPNFVSKNFITNAHNLVLKACAYTPKQATLAIRQLAWESALATFSNMPKSRKNSRTFAIMLTACKHLLLPNHDDLDEIITLIWSESCHSGQVNHIVLKRLHETCSSKGRESIIHETCQSLGVTELKVETIPNSWKRKII